MVSSAGGNKPSQKAMNRHDASSFSMRIGVTHCISIGHTQRRNFGTEPAPRMPIRSKHPLDLIMLVHRRYGYIYVGLNAVLFGESRDVHKLHIITLRFCLPQQLQDGLDPFVAFFAEGLPRLV